MTILKHLLETTFEKLWRPVVSYIRKPHPRLERTLTRTPARLAVAFVCGLIGLPLWPSIVVIGLVTGFVSAAYPYAKKYFQERKIDKKTPFWSRVRAKNAPKDFLIGAVSGALIGGLETSGALGVAFKAAAGGIKHGAALLTRAFNGKSPPVLTVKSLSLTANHAMA